MNGSILRGPPTGRFSSPPLIVNEVGDQWRRKIKSYYHGKRRSVEEVDAESLKAKEERSPMRARGRGQKKEVDADVDRYSSAVSRVPLVFLPGEFSCGEILGVPLRNPRGECIRLLGGNWISCFK